MFGKSKFFIINLLVISIMLSRVFAFSVKATELVITDNGSGSQSELNLTTQTQTDVIQSNDSQVSNNIDTSASTGNNEASLNTNSDVNITTGDATSVTSIENSTNTSIVEAGCCESGTIANVSGNGAESENSININSTNQTNIIGEQTARITNNIIGYASTGSNKANYNTSGSVTIVTGDIKAKVNLLNDPLNISNIEVRTGNPNLIAKIAGNGFYSTNYISVSQDNLSNVFTNFSADIGNYFVWDLLTGENEANGNTDGNVIIKTGNVELEIFIKNFVNLGKVKVECCPIEEEIPDGNRPEEHPKSEEKKDVSGDGGGGGGQILPEAAAVSAGGPGIVGLSDTSSDQAQSIFFWLALTLITFGGKIIVGEFSPRKFATRVTKRVK